MEPILPEPTPTQAMPQSPQDGTSPFGSDNGGQSTTQANASSADSVQQQQFVQPMQQPVQASPPIPAQPLPPIQTVPASQSDTPLIADDVDVIEKEWVDKAKNIVNKTKEDPFEQEKEVSKLQVDYLAKRYNKNIKQAQ